MSSTIPTNIRDIAQIAKVHYSTVSLALRHDPRVKKETRERICKLAAEMGYYVNPLVSTLMAQVQSAKHISYRGNIGYLSNSKQFFESHIHLVKNYSILHDRAEELGYKLEPFFLDDYEFGKPNLFKTLRNRGINGLVVDIFFSSEALASFDWDQFCCASLTRQCGNMNRPEKQINNPPAWIPFVTEDHFFNMELIFSEIFRRGYRNPAFAVREYVDGLHSHQTISAFNYFASRLKGYPKKNSIYIGDPQEPRYAHWVSNNFFDVLVSHEEDYFEASKCLPKKLYFINSDWKGGVESGIDIRRDWLVSKLVDVVVAQLHRGERGMPDIPYKIVIEGKWIDGDSHSTDES